MTPDTLTKRSPSAGAANSFAASANSVEPRSARSGRQAVIRVKDLRLRTFIGFNPEEREKRQDIVVNIEIGYELAASVRDDVVEDALDYKAITKRIIAHVEGGRFLLLEKLATDILDFTSEDSRVAWSRVRVDKPHALRFADSVSISVEFDAQAQNNGTELGE